MLFLLLAHRPFHELFGTLHSMFTYDYKADFLVGLLGAECELEALSDFGPSLVGYIGIFIHNSGWVLFLHHILSILLRWLIVVYF